MADPQAAVQTQLKNVQAKTGQTIGQLHAAVADTGLAKHGERRSWLMAQFELGYGDANMVASFIGKPLPDLGTGAPAAPPVGAEGDPLDAIYAGAKAPLRPLHDAVMAAAQALGDTKPRRRRAISACAARSSLRWSAQRRRTRWKSASMRRTCRRINA